MSGYRFVRLVVFALLSIVAAVAVSLAVLAAFALVEFPAYGNSNVLQSLTVVVQTGAVALVTAGIVLARIGERPDDYTANPDKYRRPATRAATKAAAPPEPRRRTDGGAPPTGDSHDAVDDPSAGIDPDGPSDDHEAGFRLSPTRRTKKWLVRLGKMLITTGTALLVSATLAIPLSATRLYLDGISVDQEFRTQFLTRSTTSLGLPDMAYADLPSFYPSGWFWLGGRFAQLLGIPGWEAFKPWSVVSLSVAAALVTVLWITLLRTEVAAIIAFTSTAVMVAYASHEPYGAVVAVFAPPVLILAWHALHPTARNLGRGATAVTTVFLGISASMYTLYTAVTALTVVIMAALSVALVWWSRRRRLPPTHEYRLPIVRLAVIGFGSILIALPVWAPYLYAALIGDTASSGTAIHYLPSDGAVFPLPMFAGSFMGFICLGGVVWIVARFGVSRRAQALGISVLTIYLWSLLSMALTAVGTTLLSFRTEVLIVLLLSVGAVIGLTELAQWAVHFVGRNRPRAEAVTKRQRLTSVLAVVTILAAVGYTQSIPGTLRNEIRIAYTDTDGYGERADRYPPGPQSHFSDIVSVIDREVARPREDTVVATTADGFFAFYPFLAYQAITPHYANPLGNYEARAEVIRSWEEASDPEELHELVTDTPWRAPDAIVTRTTGDGYALRPAEDAYPNDPNVSRYDVVIPRAAVGGEYFSAYPVGPFTVIIVR